MAETRFSNSGCVDESCAIEIGQLLSASEMIVGSLGKLGSRYVINVKLIDIATGRVVTDVSEMFSDIDELVDNSNIVLGALLRYNPEMQEKLSEFNDQKLQIAMVDRGIYKWNNQLFQPTFADLYSEMTEEISSHYFDDDLLRLHLEYSEKQRTGKLWMWTGLAGQVGLLASSGILYYSDFDTEYIYGALALSAAAGIFSVIKMFQLNTPPQDFIDYYNSNNPF
ncbi:MAG: hypothetical protein JEY99_21820 [Spirochaetales bacterium]|nr:hypothetical protein [Spirochaetales bacterium]